MIYKNPNAMAPYFAQCLQYVHTSFDKVESLEAKDNIVSALFKLIQRDSNGMIPLEQALSRAMQ